MAPKKGPTTDAVDDDDEVRRAIEMSLQDGAHRDSDAHRPGPASQNDPVGQTPPPVDDQVDQHRGNIDNDGDSLGSMSTTGSGSTGESDEEFDRMPPPNYRTELLILLGLIGVVVNPPPCTV